MRDSGAVLAVMLYIISMHAGGTVAVQLARTLPTQAPVIVRNTLDRSLSSECH
jgi:hypothetical protein